MMFRTLPRTVVVVFSLLVLTLAATFLPAWLQNESTLQIRTHHQGSSLPDGFYVYQSLTAQGIHIKSITPAQDSLVIKFDSPEQGEAAEKVLRKLLPSGFDIARQESNGVTRLVNRLSLRT